jgi:hypothetical protein
MTKRHLLFALMLSTLGLVPSLSACSSAEEKTAGTSSRVSENDCISFPETGHSVCDDERGRFKSTFEKFGLAAIGYPLTDVYPDGKGDWYQAFERVDMNGNFGEGCDEGRACIAHLGRWDLTNVEHRSIGADKTDDCNDDSARPRTNEICLPRDFLEESYYRNGGLEFYGHMLTRVYDNCPLYPNGILGQCFWTERAKVGRIYGRTDWEGEQLGRKKLELEGSVNGGPPPPPDPIATDPRMNLPPTTIYLPKNAPGLLNYIPGAAAAFVCEASADPALIDQFRKFESGEIKGQPTVILQTGDTKWETRRANPPARNVDYGCEGSSASWKILLWEDSAGFLQDFDLAGAFVAQFNGKALSCDVGFEMDGIIVDVKRFPIENGVLKKPALNITLRGSSTSGAKFGCSLTASTPTLYFQAGIVPIVYELWLSLGLSVKVSKPTKIQATIGTEDGASLWVDQDPASGSEFEIAPELKLGATFYRAFSAYVGLNMPITAVSKSPCTPEYKLGLELLAGAEVSGSLPFGTLLQAEWASQAMPERVIRASKCP